MKKTVVVISMLALTTGRAFAATSQGGRAINNTAHDFTGAGYTNGANTYVAPNKCTTCHAPHSAQRTEMLWGRKAPTGAWIVWNGNAVGQQLGAAAVTEDGSLTPNGVDRNYLKATDVANTGTGLCMSCHDGTIAINEIPDFTGANEDLAPYGNGTKNMPSLFSAAGAVYMDDDARQKWGTDLSNMHPVGLKVPFTKKGFKGGIDNSDNNVALEAQGTVGCTSCHSMHSSNPDSMRLIRKGEICLACHDK